MFSSSVPKWKESFNILHILLHSELTSAYKNYIKQSLILSHAQYHLLAFDLQEYWWYNIRGCNLALPMMFTSPSDKNVMFKLGDLISHT